MILSHEFGHQSDSFLKQGPIYRELSARLFTRTLYDYNNYNSQYYDKYLKSKE